MALDVGVPDAQLTDGSDVASAGMATSPPTEGTRTTHLRWVLPLVVVLFAAGIRFAYLPHPERIYFDETYYAENAAQLLDYGVETSPAVPSDPGQGIEPQFVVHPPVGKWLIAAGIAVFGDASLGWRVGPAVAGTVLVAATYFIALRLFRRRGVAALAAFLLSIEGLALTMSRISMLDIFLTMFVALGVWCLLIDRDRRWAAAAALHDDALHDAVPQPSPDAPDVAVAATPPRSGHRLPHVSRSHLWLAGLALGLALATKWSGILAIAASGLYLLGSELAWRRAVTGRWWRQPWRLLGIGLASLLAVPLVIYVASYASWFANYEHTRPGVAACGDTGEICDVGPDDIANGWFGEQQEIFRFHRDLEVTHNYRASAFNWPLTRRPVVYYYESCSEDSDEPCAVDRGHIEEIIGLGNPVIWWFALPLYPLLLWAAFARRDRVAATIAVLLSAQYVPWLVQARPLFFFYALPLVPMVVLTLTWAADRALGHRVLRWVPVAVSGAALAAFVYWLPLYYGFQISEDAWRMRMLLDSWV
jgi:dolichyl-phosphate-mannose--protein O-mannosyl transferase